MEYETIYEVVSICRNPLIWMTTSPFSPFFFPMHSIYPSLSQLHFRRHLLFSVHDGFECFVACGLAYGHGDDWDFRGLESGVMVSRYRACMAMGCERQNGMAGADILVLDLCSLYACVGFTRPYFHQIYTKAMQISKTSIVCLIILLHDIVLVKLSTIHLGCDFESMRFGST